MEILILVVVVIAFFWLRANIAQGFRDQEMLMGILKQDVAALRAKLENMGGVAADKAKVADKPASEHQAYMPPVLRTEEAVVPKPAEAEPAPIAQAKAEPVIAATPRPVVEPRYVEEEPRPSFFERHPDLEKFVGENLMNKIGIAILVLGIGFFVKYAIDKEWINEIGRMAIGILAGGLLLGIAHRLRLSLAAFSSVLVGGGLSVLYFSIGIGFHDYHLLTQTAAFGVMVLITAYAVALSVLYNRKELAVIALVGGFGTPFFLSTGEGNYQVLFTYLLILNVGMTVLAVQKKWGLVNLLSYIFTVLIYGGWLATKGGTIDSPNGGALVFGTLFYLLFFTMNVGFNPPYTETIYFHR